MDERERQILSHQKTVNTAVKIFLNKNPSFAHLKDDFRSVGEIALVEAIDNDVSDKHLVRSILWAISKAAGPIANPIHVPDRTRQLARERGTNIGAFARATAKWKERMKAFHGDASAIEKRVLNDSSKYNVEWLSAEVAVMDADFVDPLWDHIEGVLEGEFSGEFGRDFKRQFGDDSEGKYQYEDSAAARLFAEIRRARGIPGSKRKRRAS